LGWVPGQPPRHRFVYQKSQATRKLTCPQSKSSDEYNLFDEYPNRPQALERLLDAIPPRVALDAFDRLLQVNSDKNRLFDHKDFCKGRGAMEERQARVGRRGRRK
jgi:hypothetical protein